MEADGAVDAERAHRALENAVRFPQASTGPFLSIHPRKTPKGPKMALGNPDRPKKMAISEFPKGRKYLISLSFRGKASVRPAQVGGFDVNIVIHGSTAVRGRGDLVAYRWALWKLTAPWTHRTRPPHLGKRCAFSTSSTGPFPSNHSRKTPKGPKIALGNPDRPKKITTKIFFHAPECRLPPVKATFWRAMTGPARPGTAPVVACGDMPSLW